MRFIRNSAQDGVKALEIGAGVGYISKLLAEDGWQVDSIEPGKGYRPYWDKYQIKVINDFFPSPEASGPYDLIVCYTVLEHIEDTREFLKAVSNHLKPKGKFVLSVPDCTEEIAVGDPSMLLHEHYQYFTQPSLVRSLEDVGFNVELENSNFGRSIYACATPNQEVETRKSTNLELDSMRQYGSKLVQLKERVTSSIDRALSVGSVGIYCPARCLALLSSKINVRFFDDAEYLYGKYYPPFRARIENRLDLLDKPPMTLFIMSRTFGDQLARELRQKLPNTNVITISELS